MNRIKNCPECGNLLYPKEDKRRKALVYACSICPHTEPAESYRVCRNEEHRSQANQDIIDMRADPTQPRTRYKQCEKCGHRNVLYYQDTMRREDPFTLFFICCNPDCGHKWRD